MNPLVRSACISTAAVLATLLLSAEVSSRSATDQSGVRPPFAVERTLSSQLIATVPQIVASDRISLFLTGTFGTGHGAVFTFLRVNRSSMTVAARAKVPNETSVAYGDHALWWATGSLIGTAGRSLTAGHGKILLKLDSRTLHVLARFTLPSPTMLVATTSGHLWVATPSSLLRVDPSRGVVTASVPLHYQPTVLVGGPQ